MDFKKYIFLVLFLLISVISNAQTASRVMVFNPQTGRGDWVVADSELGGGSGSGSVAYDDILDPDDVSGINFGSFTNTWTSTISGVFFTIEGASSMVNFKGPLITSGRLKNSEAISSADTLDKNNEVIFCSGTTTINLPTASSISGTVYAIIHTDSNICTVDPNGVETINGELTKELSFSGSAMEIVSDGSNWRIK